MGGLLLAITGNSYGSAPVNTALPTVSGTALTGQTLTTTNGTWTGSPTPTFTYQWQRLCINYLGQVQNIKSIPGATSSSYTLTVYDATALIRCVVTASNTGGSNSATSASTNVVKPLYIGQPVAGFSSLVGDSYISGLFAGEMNVNGAVAGSTLATHYLIVTFSSRGAYLPIVTRAGSSGNTNQIDGLSNTLSLQGQGSPAANFCRNTDDGGFNDWYLPSIAELEICFFNLRPDFRFQFNNVNDTALATSGNLYAVPSRLSQSYSALQKPEITTALDFRFYAGSHSPVLYPLIPDTLASGESYPAGTFAFNTARVNEPSPNFEVAKYWSSTAEFFSTFNAHRGIQFWDGGALSNGVTFSHMVRPVRKVPVSIGSVPGDSGLPTGL